MSAETKPIKSSHTMDDIQELLYLKVSRRHKADEANIKRQLQKKESLYLENKRRYDDLYEKYVKLVQHAGTYTLLTANTTQNKAKLEEALTNVRFLETIKFDNIHTVIDADELQQCKEYLGSIENHVQLKKHKESIAKKELAIKSIQEKCDAVQTQMDRTVMSGLNYFAETLLDLDLKSAEHNS